MVHQNSVAWTFEDIDEPQARPREVASGDLPEKAQGLHILGVDPGKTTGFASYHEYQDHWRWFVWQVPYRPHYLFIWVGQELPTLIAMEEYTLGSEKSKETEALKVCGIMELAADLYKTSILYNRPTDVKPFITDRIVKGNNLWVPGMPHGNDASRQILRHLIYDKRQTEWINLLRAR